MNGKLKLVASNPHPRPHLRYDRQTLRGLAKLLTAQVRAGQEGRAEEVAAAFRLSPFDIAIVADWMTRAGIDEPHILRIVAQRSQVGGPSRSMRANSGAGSGLL